MAYVVVEDGAGVVLPFVVPPGLMTGVFFAWVVVVSSVLLLRT